MVPPSFPSPSRQAHCCQAFAPSGRTRCRQAPSDILPLKQKSLIAVGSGQTKEAPCQRPPFRAGCGAPRCQTACISIRNGPSHKGNPFDNVHENVAFAIPNVQDETTSHAFPFVRISRQAPWLPFALARRRPRRRVTVSPIQLFALAARGCPRKATASCRTARRWLSGRPPLARSDRQLSVEGFVRTFLVIAFQAVLLCWEHHTLPTARRNLRAARFTTSKHFLA